MYFSNLDVARWHHDIEILAALLALCEGNPPVTIWFPSQRASDAKLWYSFHFIGSLPCTICNKSNIIYLCSRYIWSEWTIAFFLKNFVFPLFLSYIVFSFMFDILRFLCTIFKYIVFPFFTYLFSLIFFAYLVFHFFPHTLLTLYVWDIFYFPVCFWHLLFSFYGYFNIFTLFTL